MKKVANKNSSEFIREKSSSATPDSTKNSDKGQEKEEETDELGSLSSKLLDKLAEEESKLKKINNLEIGTWSNEMAEKVENLYDDGDEVSNQIFLAVIPWLTTLSYLAFCKVIRKCLILSVFGTYIIKIFGKKKVNSLNHINLGSRKTYYLPFGQDKKW